MHYLYNSKSLLPIPRVRLLKLDEAAVRLAKEIADLILTRESSQMPLRAAKMRPQYSSGKHFANGTRLDRKRMSCCCEFGLVSDDIPTARPVACGGLPLRLS